MRFYRRPLVHGYYYVENKAKDNELHYAALMVSMGMLLRRLFCLQQRSGALALKIVFNGSSRKLGGVEEGRLAVSCRVRSRVPRDDEAR